MSIGVIISIIGITIVLTAIVGIVAYIWGYENGIAFMTQQEEWEEKFK